jgi:hypothetical protein
LLMWAANSMASTWNYTGLDGTAGGYVCVPNMQPITINC